MAVAVFGPGPAPRFAGTQVVARACAPEQRLAVAAEGLLSSDGPALPVQVRGPIVPDWL
jgi:hypothetical protein